MKKQIKKKAGSSRALTSKPSKPNKRRRWKQCMALWIFGMKVGPCQPAFLPKNFIAMGTRIDCSERETRSITDSAIPMNSPSALTCL